MANIKRNGQRKGFMKMPPNLIDVLWPIAQANCRSLSGEVEYRLIQSLTTEQRQQLEHMESPND